MYRHSCSCAIASFASIIVDDRVGLSSLFVSLISIHALGIR